MSTFLQRYKWFFVLAVLLILNVIRYWPVKHASLSASTGLPPGMGSGSFQAMDPARMQAMGAAIQARIDALPDDQRAAAQQRMQQDREFFASLQNLPQSERMAKMMEHFMENPPPPRMMPPMPQGGMPPGSGGGGFNGFQANGGVPPILPPDQRQPVEQSIVNMMRGAANQ
jgi:hypothetical protein